MVSLYEFPIQLTDGQTIARATVDSRASMIARLRAAYPSAHRGCPLADADAVVIVEPYLAGTSIRLIDDALVDRPHRTLALGVARTELRRYGTAADHSHRYRLDAAGM